MSRGAPRLHTGADNTGLGFVGSYLVALLPTTALRAAVRASAFQFSGGVGEEFGELCCKLGPAVQIEPVSSRRLPKAGTFQ
jgi:hypothetical protein